MCELVKLLFIISVVCSKFYRSHPDRKQMCKFWPFPPLGIWFFDAQNAFHFILRGLKNAFSMPFSWLPIETIVLWRVLTMFISSHPFTLSIYHILDFWCKICFRIHYHNPRSNTPLEKQARKLERCATLRWNLRTAVKLAHSQNCRPQSRKKSKWNLCNCDCWKTCTETTANRRDGVISREAIPSHKWVPQFFPGGTDLLIQTCQESDPSPVNYFRFWPDDMSRFNTMSLRKMDHLSWHQCFIICVGHL